MADKKSELREIGKELETLDKQWDKDFYDVPIGERKPDSPENRDHRKAYGELIGRAEKLVAIETPLPSGFEYGHPGRTWMGKSGRMLPKVRENVMYAMRILPSVNSPVESWGKIVPFGPDFNKRLKELGFEEWGGSFLTPTKYKDTHLVRYAAPRDFIVAPEGKQAAFKKWLRRVGVSSSAKIEPEAGAKSINETLGFSAGNRTEELKPLDLITVDLDDPTVDVWRPAKKPRKPGKLVLLVRKRDKPETTLGGIK